MLARGPAGGARIRLLVLSVAVVAALALFLAGWQLAWRWGPYAAACFSIAAVGGLAAGLAIVATRRLAPRAGRPAGAPGAAETRGGRSGPDGPRAGER